MKTFREQAHARLAEQVRVCSAPADVLRTMANLLDSVFVRFEYVRVYGRTRGGDEWRVHIPAACDASRGVRRMRAAVASDPVRAGVVGYLAEVAVQEAIRASDRHKWAGAS